MTYKFLIAFLSLIFALFLQILLGDASGIWINFALSALVAAACFVDFTELLVLILCSVFVLNWQPAASAEIILFACLPCIVFFTHKLLPFPFRSWLMSALAVFSCTLIFYLVFGAGLIVHNPQLFFADLACAIISGAIVFNSLAKIRLA